MTTELRVAEPGNGRLPRVKRQRRGVTARQVSSARRWITVGMGCGIPCQALALSSIGGRLCQEGQRGLGVAVLAVCCGVLEVSLSHLAWAIRDITGSARWQSRCLAVAVD